MPETLHNWAELCDEIAEAHGWNDKEVSVAEFIALGHSELSEALEEYRKGNMELYFSTDEEGLRKPEGYGIELADVIIRVLHECIRRNLDIEALMDLKLQYNKLRPYRHGGKVI